MEKKEIDNFAQISTIFFTFNLNFVFDSSAVSASVNGPLPVRLCSALCSVHTTLSHDVGIRWDVHVVDAAVNRLIGIIVVVSARGVLVWVVAGGEVTLLTGISSCYKSKIKKFLKTKFNLLGQLVICWALDEFWIKCYIAHLYSPLNPAQSFQKPWSISSQLK